MTVRRSGDGRRAVVRHLADGRWSRVPPYGPREHGPVSGPDPEHVPGCGFVPCADGLTARRMVLLKGAENSSGALTRGVFP